MTSDEQAVICPGCGQAMGQTANLEAVCNTEGCGKHDSPLARGLLEVKSQLAESKAYLQQKLGHLVADVEVKFSDSEAAPQAAAVPAASKVVEAATSTAEPGVHDHERAPHAAAAAAAAETES